MLGTPFSYLLQLFLRQNVQRIRWQRKTCGGILIGVNDTLMPAAKILAVPAPAAAKSNMPFAAERKLHSVMVVIGAAEISDNNHIVALLGPPSNSKIPPMPAM